MCWWSSEKTSMKKSSQTHIIFVSKKIQLQVKDILRLKLQSMHSIFSVEMQNQVIPLQL